MTIKPYQAFGFPYESFFFAVLDLNFKRLIVAIIIVSIIPQSLVEQFAGPATGLIFLIIFLVLAKRCFTTLLFYSAEEASLYLLTLGGFSYQIRQIDSVKIKQFTLEKKNNCARAHIELKDASIIVPVKSYTTKKNISSIQYLYRVLGKRLNANVNQSSQRKSNKKSTPNYQRQPTRSENQSPTEYIPPTSLTGKRKENAIGYIRRPELSSVTREKSSRVKPVLVILCIFLIGFGITYIY